MQTLDLPPVSRTGGQRTESPSSEDSGSDIAEMFGKDDSVSLNRAVDQMIKLRNSYDALAHFMNNGRNAEVPALVGYERNLETRLNRVSHMCYGLLKELENENRAIRNIISEATAETAKQERWWESGNAFSLGESASFARQ
jgi:hypothetical protein